MIDLEQYVRVKTPRFRVMRVSEALEEISAECERLCRDSETAQTMVFRRAFAFTEKQLPRAPKSFDTLRERRAFGAKKLRLLRFYQSQFRKVVDNYFRFVQQAVIHAFRQRGVGKAEGELLKAEEGDIIIRSLDWRTMNVAGSEAFVPAMLNIMQHSAGKTSQFAQLRGAFDVRNARHVAAAEAAAGQLVTGISTDVQANIRTIATRAADEGLTIRNMTRDIGPQITALPSMVGRIERDVSQMLSDGISGARVERYRQREMRYATNYRAHMIARTEANRFANEGTLATYESAGIVHARFLRNDGACVICESIFDAGGIYPIAEARGMIPVHPNCRCTWIPIIPEEGLPGMAEPEPPPPKPSKPTKPTKPKPKKPPKGKEYRIEELKAGEVETIELSTKMRTDWPDLIDTDQFTEAEQALFQVDATRTVVYNSQGKISGVMSHSIDEGMDGGMTLIVNHLGTLEQKVGMGKELMRHAVDAAIKGNVSITLESTPLARKFYEHLGFKAHPKIPKIYQASLQDLKAMQRSWGKPTKGKWTSGKPIPSKVVSPDAWPETRADIDALEHVQDMGGSTGAVKVRDPRTGREFILKRGDSAAHLMEEAAADAAYQAAGVNVPAFRLIETARGPVKLSEFIPNTESLKSVLAKGGPRAKKVVRAIQKDMHMDALLGNWDVVGLKSDNILIDAKGVAWRIDNGGALRRRAQGALKRGWSEHVDEFWTLRKKIGSIDNATAHAVFGDMSIYDIEKGMKRFTMPQRKAMLEGLPKDLKGIMEKRLAYADDLMKTVKTMRLDGWTDDYVDGFAQHLTGLRKSGVTKRYPEKMIQQGGTGKVVVVDEHGKEFDHLRGSDTITKDIHAYITDQGGDPAILSHWFDRQAGSSMSSASMSIKEYYRKVMGRNFDDLFWHDQTQSELSKQLKKFVTSQAGGSMEVLDTTLQAWHASQYEFMKTVAFRNNAMKTGQLKLIRTQSSIQLKMAKVKVGTTGNVAPTAMIESSSIFKPYFLGGDAKTLYHDVPHHRVLGNYMFSRNEGWRGGLLAGDYENEFLVILDRLKFEWPVPPRIFRRG